MFICVHVDALPWLELMVSRRKQWELKDIIINKASGQTVGMTFIEVLVSQTVVTINNWIRWNDIHSGTS